MAIFRSCSPTSLSDPCTFLIIRSRISPISLPRLSLLISSLCMAPANHSCVTTSAKSSKRSSSMSLGSLYPWALAATRVSTCLFYLDTTILSKSQVRSTFLPRIPFAEGWLSSDTSGTYILILSDILASFGAHCSATILLKSLVNCLNFLHEGFGNILSSRGSLHIKL